MSRTENVKVVQPVNFFKGHRRCTSETLIFGGWKVEFRGPVYRSNLVGANTPPRSLPESVLNSPEFITAHRKRPLDAAIDRRRFELDELDVVVASHDLSLAAGILPTRQAKGHGSPGNRARRGRRRRRGVAGKARRGRRRRRGVAGKAGRGRRRRRGVAGEAGRDRRGDGARPAGTGRDRWAMGRG